MRDEKEWERKGGIGGLIFQKGRRKLTGRMRDVKM